jgi:tellurite resistance protein TehA-like permease
VVKDAGEACGLEDDEGSGFIGSVIFLVIVILCLVAYILYSRYKMKKFMEGKEENKDYQDNFEEK